mmetsp:Transcript_34589/g.85068  ORF Transcript_34589/g.85068 Transcript_34589/m.85068 type:complete len:141 (-) Transcript_34589:403-825(-)
MVKHAARRSLQGLHNYLVDREAKDKARLERNARKREEKKQQMAVDSAGEGGVVKALDGVKFKGEFGVDFDKTRRQSTVSVADVEMDGEDKVVLCKSVRKQRGIELSKKNYLIKKHAKKERKKEAMKGKVKVKHGKRKMKG